MASTVEYRIPIRQSTILSTMVVMDRRRPTKARGRRFCKPTVICCSTISDQMQRAAVQKTAPPEIHRSLLARLRRLILTSPRLLLDSLRLLLPTAIFFIKFLEWWYSPGSPARSLSNYPQGPAIPPPSILRPHPQGIHFDKQAYGVCPICRKSIVNATALPSGYLFCYRCAYDQVETHGKCPVTLLPARVWQLRKVLV
jgi:hypothetical protein